MREKIILVGAIALLALSPTTAFGQQRPPPMPPASEILSRISVRAPVIQPNIVNRDSQESRSRVIGRFTVFNGSEYDVTDLKVRCDFIGESGTSIQNFEITLYSVFQARKSRSSAATEERRLPEQAVRVECEPLPDNKRFAYRAPEREPEPKPIKPTVLVDDPAAPPRCLLAQCPDYSEIFHTCDCDLADNLVNHPRFPRYFIPVRSREAANWYRRNQISDNWYRR